jgi:hypothetical protein
MRSVAASALLVAGSLWFSTAVPAEDMALQRQAKEEFAKEVTTCSAYLLIRMEFLRNGGRNNYIVMSELMADGMVAKAEQLMPAEKAQTEIRAAGLRLLDEIGRDLGKLELLNEKYGLICHTIYSEPDARLAYWVNTIRSGETPASFQMPEQRGRAGRRSDSP